MRKKMKSIVLGLTIASTIAVASTALAATVTINSDGPNTGKTALEIFQQYFGSDPVDGPTDSSHINETTSTQIPGGNVFQFKVGTASDTAALDGSNTDRQRVELKAYKSSPSNVTAKNGETVTYKWQFRAMSPYPVSPAGNFHHIFQLKAQDGDDGAPILTFTVEDGYLAFRHSPIGTTMDQVETLAKTAFSNIDGQWVEATVTVKHSDNGSVNMTLKKLNGTTLMSYSGNKDMWRDGATINRPKWGIYRKFMTVCRKQKSNLPTSKLRNNVESAEGYSSLGFCLHSAATLLIESDTDLKIIQERLGHTKFSTTADLYSHVTKKMKKTVSERLDKFCPQTSPPLKAF
ncbi:heparin lyase I family protein [Paenibacillus sp. N3.4]|uniref:heparin lyase I family protein n=1 Tax=Paenibacillus sp. N3.4 TaxID=2603222 RepID=UPI0011CA1927|nr:heparin lyase I family protein [Paenibacillus sp. N3.4]TXK79144.1 tyrosine-type recombinase/integrase [Paenibacillus sp. N3.4]